MIKICCGSLGGLPTLAPPVIEFPMVHTPGFLWGMGFNIQGVYKTL